MVARRRRVVDVSSRDVGAGALAAVAALVASLVFLPALVASLVPFPVLSSAPLWSSPDAQYWFGYAPGFAFLAGSLVGTVVWRRVVSRTAAPGKGALAGVATAVGTVLLVPVLVGLYVALFPALLGVVTGQGWRHVRPLYPEQLGVSVGFARTVALGWSPPVGAVLVPLGALGAWAYQRGARHRAR